MVNRDQIDRQMDSDAYLRRMHEISDLKRALKKAQDANRLALNLIRWGRIDDAQHILRQAVLHDSDTKLR